MRRKIAETDQDILLFFLNYHNTLITEIKYSPAELFQSRSIQTTISVPKTTISKPKFTEPEVKNGINQKKENQKSRYNSYRVQRLSLIHI